MKNNDCKKIGKVFASVGVPLLIIGSVATSFSATNLTVISALVGMAFSGIAFIFLSGMFDL